MRAIGLARLSADDVGTTSDHDDDASFVAEQCHRFLGGDVADLVLLGNRLQRRHARRQLTGVDPRAQQSRYLSVQRLGGFMINCHPGIVRNPLVNRRFWGVPREPYGSRCSVSVWPVTQRRQS
jgi:hypothetical protein